jgi:hypothetical protein
LTRQELTKAKLKVALRELVIRERQYAVAKRGLIKVMKEIAKLGEQLEKYELAKT